MASKTQATEHRRLMRNKGMGKKNKAKKRNQGTTRSESELFGDKKK